jgi:cytochrome P450
VSAAGVDVPPQISPAASPVRPPGRPWRENIRLVQRLLRDPLEMAEDFAVLARGGAGLLRAVSANLVLITDPDLITKILLDRDEAFVKDQFTRDLDILLGQGLLTAEGELWKRQRKLIAPSLQPRQIAAYAASMARIAEAYAARLPVGKSADVHHELMQMTLDIVVETLFGAQLQGEHEEVGRWLELVMEDYARWVRSLARLLPRWFPNRRLTRIRRASRQLNRLIDSLIADKRGGDLAGDDLLTRLLLARDDQGQAMDETQLRDELVTMFSAGHETTALALSYALFLLAHHPEIQDRARAEALALDALDVKSPEKTPFLAAVIRETMRLYPPAWAIGREPVRDVVVGDYSLRRGDQILIAPYLLHRDSRWFDHPTEFRPERWLDGLAERLPRHVYMPFGGGPRICIGNFFALMEAQLVLAALLRAARFEPEGPAQLKLLASITLRPIGGIPLKIRAIAQ